MRIWRLSIYVLWKRVLHNDNVPTYLNLELKTEGFLPWFLSQKVVQVLKKKKHRKKILFSSFNPMSLYFVRKLMPEIPRAFLVGRSHILMSKTMDRSLKLAQPQMLNVGYKLLEKESTRNRVISYKLPVSVWTVNDMEKAKFFLDRGAASIISDEPPPSHLR